mgnify:CR=1 FL=1
MYDYANCRGYSNTAMAGTNGKRLTHSAAGKGVALGSFLTQAIRRGDVVVFIDPKNSRRLKREIGRAHV